MNDHRTATREQWLAARLDLLKSEKELTRLQDQVATKRRGLPWVKVEKNYVFDTPQGPQTLSDLFDGRSQLLVQHFMFAPGWEQGCKSCSYMADHSDGANIHLAERDVTLLAISRAPLADIQRFRKRMGWQFNWVSSHGIDFNHDFAVSFTVEERARNEGKVHYNFGLTAFPQDEAPGISVFCKDDAGNVFHTYSRYGRGVEVMMGAYALLDLTPKGRDEAHLGHTMEWVRHHDRYETAGAEHANARKTGTAANTGNSVNTVKLAEAGGSCCATRT